MARRGGPSPVVVDAGAAGNSAGVARCRQRGEHAQWQRCRVHFMRNILGRVGKAHGEMVTATIRTIFARRHFTRSVVIDAAVRYLVA